MWVRRRWNNKHFHSFFFFFCCCFPFCIKSVITSFSMSKNGSETHWGKFSHFLSKDPQPPICSPVRVEFQKKKKWGKKRKGKNSRPHCCSQPMRIAEPQQEKEEEEKEGKRERYFHPAPPMKWRVRGGGEENGVDATSAFAFSSHMLSQTPFVYQSRVSVKSNIVLRWFWSSPESFNTLWFVRWKRHFTRILSQFSHKVCGWKGRFVFESWTLVISLLLKCHLFILFYYLLVLCCLSRV